MLSEGRSPSVQSIFSFISREGMYLLMSMVTDSVFKNEEIMADILLSEDDENPGNIGETEQSDEY